MWGKIYCVGDSHASFFSGYDQILPLSPKTRLRYPVFEPYRLGAILAYNIAFFGSTSRSKELFFDLLELKIPKGATILLIFGEIDCRVHIVKNAKINNIPIKLVAKETVDRYKQFINEVRNLGFDVLIWNVVPTSCCQSLNPEYPHNGTIEERTQATLFFNKYLNEFCNNQQIRFLNIYNFLVNKDGIMNRKYFKDCVHVSQNAMKFLLSELKLPIYYYFLYYFYFSADSFPKIWNKIKIIFK